MKEHYSLSEAQEALGVSKSTLEAWLRKEKALTQALKKQRFPDDMRQKFLTRAQLEQLAAAHRRQIATPDTLDPLARLEAVDSALSERIDALEARVTRLEQQSQKTENPPR